jgi:hypothetical protein
MRLPRVRFTIGWVMALAPFLIDTGVGGTSPARPVGL